MPLEFMGRAPYAPSTAITAIVTQHRKTPIPKFDATVLSRLVGITESLIPRTLAALTMLGMSDDEGNATPEFMALARVPEADLKPAFADMLRTAYEPVLASLGGDPAQATHADLAAAFRSYNPLGQLDRMVLLFTGLMAYVGIMPEATKRRPPGEAVPRSRTITTPAGSGQFKEQKQQEKPRVAAHPSIPESIRHGGELPAYSRSVSLAGGSGTITLSGTVNVFGLKGKSRDFVFSLIDLMDDYEITSDEQEAVGERSAGGDHA